MISKELLSEVLGYTPFKIDKIKQVDGVGLTLILLNQDGTVRSYQNIYQLAHKCKEWAYTQGYILFSKIRLNSSLASCYFDTMGKHDYEDGYHNDFRAESEPEAIFKACQWILDNKDSK